MNTRWFISRGGLFLLAFAFCVFGVCIRAAATGNREEVPAPSRQEEWADSYQRSWNKLIPGYAKMQFAGGMGLISAGIGWDYGRKEQWETDVLFGVLPRFSGAGTSATFTLKQNYIPWRKRLSPRWEIEPLETGIYVNKLLSRNFWGREPEKYGGSYYRFATNLRFSIFLGQRITYNLGRENRHQAVSFFYEISTNDLYFVSACTNRSLKFHEILILSFGVKFHFL